MFVWEDQDEDSGMVTEFRNFEGHREDITHMAGERRPHPHHWRPPLALLSSSTTARVFATVPL